MGRRPPRDAAGPLRPVLGALLDRYLKPGGTIAFVLPYAALNRPAYAGLREGIYGTAAQVCIVEAWSFDEDVQPLFPVPACVLIARRGKPGPLPAQVTRYGGNLPRRDATEAEADRALRHATAPWPPIPKLEGASPYRARFTNGATIYPRRFFFVEPEQAGRLGMNPAAPRMHGRVSGLDKRPWNLVTPPRGPVEKEFLHPVLLGESLAPFRLLAPATAVIPLDGRTLLDARGAADRGHRSLAAWLRDIEAKWSEHSNKDAHGKPRMTLRQQLDHMRKLTIQRGTQRELRLAYAKAGTLPAAAIVDMPEAIFDHMVYWASIRSVEEGNYLAAIINSETARARIATMQPRGQGGARHFDNLVWELPIPEFDARNALHRALADIGAEAARVAARVPLDPGQHFTRQRRAIRGALTARASPPGWTRSSRACSAAEGQAPGAGLAAALRSRSEIGGWGGIRTHEPLRVGGFQDRCLKPLGHPSEHPRLPCHAPRGIGVPARGALLYCS